MKIQITVGDQRFHATLSESAAGRDLVAQLPVTVKMIDHGSVEKTGPLPLPLSLDGQPDGADPDVGDVGYYAPATTSSSITATSPITAASWFSVGWTATQPRGSPTWMAPSPRPSRLSTTDRTELELAGSRGRRCTLRGPSVKQIPET